ncbi:MAG: hypothetical protein ABTQ28_13780, partial [Thauera sp.]
MGEAVAIGHRICAGSGHACSARPRCPAALRYGAKPTGRVEFAPFTARNAVPVIRIENLRKTYRAADGREVEALADIEL